MKDIYRQNISVTKTIFKQPCSESEPVIQPTLFYLTVVILWKSDPVPDCFATLLHYITSHLVFLYSSAKYETCQSFKFWTRNPHKLIFVFISLAHSCWDLVFLIYIHFSFSELFLYPLLTLPVFPPTGKSWFSQGDMPLALLENQVSY